MSLTDDEVERISKAIMGTAKFLVCVSFATGALLGALIVAVLK